MLFVFKVVTTCDELKRQLDDTTHESSLLMFRNWFEQISFTDKSHVNANETTQTMIDNYEGDEKVVELEKEIGWLKGNV